MSIALKQVRQAISTKIEGITGFKESRLPFQYFERNSESILHKCFTVQIGTVNQGGTSQRRGNNLFVQTDIEIKFAYRLRPKDIYPTDYDNALDSETQIINTLLGSYSSIQNEMNIQFVSSNRQINDNLEYQIHTLNFISYFTLN